MKKKFVWEKWRDPLLSNKQDVEWPDWDEEEEFEDDDEDYYDDGFPPQDESQYHKNILNKIQRQPVMSTPFGQLSLIDDACADNYFDFWVMHVNFNLTESLGLLIETVPGVETMEITTRYRARIGFPRSGLFQPREVMHEIEKCVQQFFLHKQNRELIGLDMNMIDNIISIRDTVNDNFEHWCLLVFPNGSVESVGSDTKDDDFNNKCGLLLSTKDVIGGRIISSEI